MQCSSLPVQQTIFIIHHEKKLRCPLLQGAPATSVRCTRKYERRATADNSWVCHCQKRFWKVSSLIQREYWKQSDYVSQFRDNGCIFISHFYVQYTFPCKSHLAVSLPFEQSFRLQSIRQKTYCVDQPTYLDNQLVAGNSAKLNIAVCVTQRVTAD